MSAVSLPLTTLLSWALVAFTIEFDNEAEGQMPHRTTSRGSGGAALHAPWLVSMVMWLNCMQFVDADGLTVGELERRAGTPTNLGGMERWGYITVERAATSSGRRRPSERVIRATAAGLRASAVWAPLTDVIEGRWRSRFGPGVVDGLRHALAAVVGARGLGPPNCMPILGHGLWTRTTGGAQPGPAAGKKSASLPLAALLARTLIAIAVDFESDFELSLAICANVLRLLDEGGVDVAALPGRTGVSKEAIAMALGVLGKTGHATVEPLAPPRRGRVVRLTPAGRPAQAAYADRLAGVERRWQADIGDDAVARLREVLERLVGEPTPDSPLFSGLASDPQGWRASVPHPSTLPHFPMVLHRGGFPDGS